jgi:UDP-N-acetylglucosamine 4,6-dehydratase/5-epimerase
MNDFKGKTILITGGTGSFGNAVLRGLLNTDVGEVRIFSRDELKQEKMRKNINNPVVKFYIGDTRDRSSVDGAMKSVDIVFHAAALKQVPSCEFFPIQAVLTNIIGSNNVIQSAIGHGVGRIICLSTDKAVYPINAMGMSKGLMEKCAQASARNLTEGETVVSCVRYGNVICSRGSVIPLFIKQIKDGKPITVTDPGMTRFLLSLDEAVKLVYFAFEKSEQGDIFVRKSPACTIDVLLGALKKIFNSNAPIKIIGIRHGEKIYETLVTREEMSKAEDSGDFFRIKMDGRDLNYDKYFIEGDVEEKEYQDFTSHNTRRLNGAEVEEMLLGLPEVQAELK